MLVKIKKSAGIIYKNDVLVVQVGKEMNFEKSLANHLIKIGIAETIKDETKNNIKTITKVEEE